MFPSTPGTGNIFSPPGILPEGYSSSQPGLPGQSIPDLPGQPIPGHNPHLPPIPAIPLDPQPSIPVKTITKKICKKRMYFDPDGSVAAYVLLNDIINTHGQDNTDRWKQLAGEQECFVIPGGDVSHNLPDNQLGIPYSVYEKYSNLL